MNENIRHPSKELSSSRVILKRNADADAEELFRCVDGDRERLREFLLWVDLTKTLDEQRAYVKLAKQKWDDGSMFDYGIYLRATSELIGSIGAVRISWRNKRCEIGYWVLAAYEGKGYVSEAVASMEAELFRLGFNRIEIRCSSRNTKSARVPSRSGYLLEGTLRQDSIEYGRYRDTLVYAKLKSDQPTPSS